MVAASTTVPCTWLAIATVGYRGLTPLSLWPSITPEEMTGFLEGATCTCGVEAEPIESGRPLKEPLPLASSTGPESLGSDSSSADTMRSGITRGAVKAFREIVGRVAVVDRAIWTRGGAGGAGAASSVLKACFGKDAGCSRGNNISRHATQRLHMAATLEDQPRCVLNLPPDSTSASSNMEHLASRNAA